MLGGVGGPATRSGGMPLCMTSVTAPSSVCRDDPVERLKKSLHAPLPSIAIACHQSAPAPERHTRPASRPWRELGCSAAATLTHDCPLRVRSCVPGVSRSFLGFEPLNRRKRASSAGAFTVGICCIGTDESGFQRRSRPDDVRVSPCTDLVVLHSRHSGMSSQIEPQNQAVTIGLRLKRSFAGASRRFWSSINQPLLDAPQHNHSVCVCTLRVILDAPTVGRLGKLLLVYHNE